MIGPLELGVITLGFLLFVGYDRLPKAGRQLGRAVREPLRGYEESADDDHTN